jgi:ribosomal protein L1
MSIPDAAAILKVGCNGNGPSLFLTLHTQAVEVGTPNSAYELSVLTHFVRGQAAHRGKVSLPRDPRTKAEVMLVFAEGRQGQAAIKAGASYVGGVGLIGDVRMSSAGCPSF